jgi:hypothetical protein
MLLSMMEITMLLDIPEVRTTLESLRKSFQAFDATGSYNAYLARCESVDEWKFSDGDYFGHLPHDTERMGFSTPRLMKKKYSSVEEARELGKYCSGFSGGRHSITVLPGQKGVQSIQAMLYDHEDTFLEIRTVGFKGMDRGDKLDARLIGLGRLFQLADGDRVYVGVSARDAFSVFLYKYSSTGKVLSGRAIANGWPGEDEWFYHYDSEGQLAEITSGAASVWTRK